MKIRCLIVEDQLMFLELLVATLKTVPRLAVVATATNMKDGLLALEQHKPDLGIFDLFIPGGNGMKLAKIAKETVPGFECILLTAQPDQVESNPDPKKRVRAIVDKVRAFDVLLGEIDALIKERFPTLKTAARSDPGLLLTPRELEVFHRLGQGYGNKQIAAELFVALNTVESHRKSISRKLRCSGSELVRTAALYCRQAPDRAERQTS